MNWPSASFREVYPSSGVIIRRDGRMNGRMSHVTAYLILHSGLTRMKCNQGAQDIGHMRFLAGIVLVGFPAPRLVLDVARVANAFGIRSCETIWPFRYFSQL